MFWNIIIGIAAFFLNLVLNPKPQNAKPASLGDFNVPTAEEGLEIPVVFGTVNIRNPNCVWYGDLIIQEIKGPRRYGFFGPRQVTGHRYALGMHSVLCHGCHDEIREIWVGEKKMFPKAPSTVVATGNTDVLIDQFDAFGGDEGEGGIYGFIHVEDGDPSQGANSYLVEKMGAGANTPAFRGVVSIIWHAIYIGNSPYLKNWEYVLKRIHKTSRGDEQWYDAKAAVPDTPQTAGSEPGVELDPAVHTMNAEMKLDGNAGYAAYSEGGILYTWALPEGTEQVYDPPNPPAGLYPQGKYGSCVWITDEAEVMLQYLGTAWANSDVYLHFANAAEPSEATQTDLNLTDYLVGEGVPYTNLNAGYCCSQYQDNILIRLWPVFYQQPFILLTRDSPGEAWGFEYAVTSLPASIDVQGPATLSMGPTYAYGITGYWAAVGVRRITWEPGSFDEDDVDLAALGMTGTAHTAAYCAGTNEVVVVTTTGVFVFNEALTVLERSKTDFPTPINVGAADSNRMFVSTTKFVLHSTNNATYEFFYEVDIADLDITNTLNVRTSNYTNKNESGPDLLKYDMTSAGFAAATHSLMPITYWPYTLPDALDMNPSHIIRECLTDRTWGMGYADADIDDTSFMAAADTLYDECFGLSLQWNREEELQEFISIILSHIDAYLYLRRTTGKFYLKLIRNDYDIDEIPVFDEDDVVFWDEVSRRAPPEAVNSVIVKYVDRRNRGRDASTQWDAIGQIQQLGARVSATRFYPGISRSGLAIRVARRDQGSLGVGMISGRLTGKRTWDVLYPGDPFRLVSSRQNLDGEVCRVAELKFGDGRENLIRVKFVQDVFNLNAEELVDPSQGDWEIPVNPPEPAEPRLVWEMPYLEITQMIGGGDTATMLAGDPDAGMIQAAAGKPTSDSIDAALMVDDVEEETMGFAPAGFLAVGIGRFDASVSLDDDTDSDLDLIEAGSLAVILSADDPTNPDLMEIVRVDAVSGADLTVSRGMLDTVPQLHGAGDWFVAYDDFGMPDFEQRTATDAPVVQILTRTPQDTLDESDAPDDTVTLDSRAIRPYRPANVEVEGEIEGPVTASGDVDVTWSNRNRLTETTPLEWTDADVTAEAGQTTVIEVYDPTNTTLLTTHDSLAGTSYSVPVASFDGNDSGWLHIGAERDGYREWQAYQVEVFVGEGVTVESLELDGEALLLDGEALYLSVAATDPSFSSVVLLSGFEGADASTTFDDESTPNHTLTAAGNAQIDTAQFKYGTSSLLLDGTGDNVSSADSADWDFGTGSFTIEGWWRFGRTTHTEALISHYRAAAGLRDWAIFVDNAAQIRFTIDGPTNVLTSSGWSGVINTWYHICVDRNGSAMRLYVDGVMKASATDSSDISTSTAAMRIGASEDSGGTAENFFQGHADEIRITKGVSRYGSVYGDSGFTPPTVAFPRS